MEGLGFIGMWDKKMSKYDIIPIKPHKARVEHLCHICDKLIKKGEIVCYQRDRFLQNIRRKKFCEKCFEKYGQNLLTIKKKDKSQTTLK